MDHRGANEVISRETFMATKTQPPVLHVDFVPRLSLVQTLSEGVHRKLTLLGAPTGYGLYDVTGEIWDRTSDYFSPRHPDEVAKPCCVPRNPRIDSPEGSHAIGQPGAHIPRKVIKGGSHRCEPPYRPTARQGEAVDTSPSHIGFRCIVRGA